MSATRDAVRSVIHPNSKPMQHPVVARGTITIGLWFIHSFNVNEKLGIFDQKQNAKLGEIRLTGTMPSDYIHARWFSRGVPRRLYWRGQPEGAWTYRTDAATVGRGGQIGRLRPSLPRLLPRDGVTRPSQRRKTKRRGRKHPATRRSRLRSRMFYFRRSHPHFAASACGYAWGRFGVAPA